MHAAHRGDVDPAATYVRHGLPSVPGWFNPTDAWLFTVCNQLQQAAGIRGDLLEIGAYLGKTAILLGYFRQHGERLHVCDLFEDEAPTGEMAAEQQRWYRGLTRARYEQQFARFHDEPAVVLAGLSADVLAGLPDLSCRFIHIDGSHVYDVVVEDIAASARLLRPDGVLVLDDVIQRHTPGVAAATWEAVASHGLVPVATTAKLYATWGPSTVVGAKTLRAQVEVHPHLVVVDEHSVRGHPILQVAERPSEDD